MKSKVKVKSKKAKRIIKNGDSEMRILKILNPLIWLVNIFCHFSHLLFFADIFHQTGIDMYEPYDFSKDWKYF